MHLFFEKSDEIEAFIFKCVGIYDALITFISVRA